MKYTKPGEECPSLYFFQCLECPLAVIITFLPFTLSAIDFQQSVNLRKVYFLSYSMNRILISNSGDPMPFYAFVQLDTILGCFRICVHLGQGKGAGQLGLYLVWKQLH